MRYGIRLCSFQCDTTKQFTCWNGECISIDEKCNQEFNCEDGSDEQECDLIKLDSEKYRKEFVPRKHSSKEKLKVKVGFDVFDIVEVNQIKVRLFMESIIPYKNYL